jgi:hypothetical protein
MKTELIRLRSEAETAAREGEVALILAAARYPDNDILPPLVDAAGLIAAAHEAMDATPFPSILSPRRASRSTVLLSTPVFDAVSSEKDDKLSSLYPDLPVAP